MPQAKRRARLAKKRAHSEHAAAIAQPHRLMRRFCGAFAALLIALCASAPLAAIAAEPVDSPLIVRTDNTAATRSTVDHSATRTANVAVLAAAALAGLSVKALTEKRKQEADAAKALADKAKSETRSLTDDEARDADIHLDNVDTIDAALDERRSADQQAAEQRARQQRLAALANTGHTPAGNLPDGPQPGEERRSAHRDDPVANPDAHGYRMLRAIDALLNHRQLDGVEGEVSQEIAKRCGKAPQGFYMPHNLQVRTLHGASAESRALDTSAVAGAIPDVMRPGMIDLLRNRTRIVRAGATLISGLVGNVELPKQTGTAQSYWVGEGGAPTGSAAAIGQIQMSPTTQGAYTDLTRRAIAQTSMDMEQFARNDLLQVMALELDRVAIAGSGSSNQPKGILNESNFTTVAVGTNGGAITRAHLLACEEAVAINNADEATIQFMTNPKVRKALKQLTLDDGSGLFAWARDNTVEGYATQVTNQVPANLSKGTAEETLSALIFGDFSTVLMGFWSGLDVMIDPYSLSTSGGVRIVVLQDVQIKFRRFESLVKMVDILPG